MSGSRFAFIAFLLSGATLGFIAWATYAVVVLHDAGMHAENGVLENAQALVLALSCIAFIVPAVRGSRTDKLILLFCAVLCLAFVLREVDVEYFDVHDAIKLVGSGAGRNIMLGAAFFALLAYALIHYAYYKRAAIAFLRARPGKLLIVGGILVVSGDGFEKLASVPYHDYIEEVLELAGYVFILLAALATNAFFSAPPAPDPTQRS